ncbi:MAG: cadherin-like beta sandwich domain-containing protein [Bacillota bacterium]|nr:cadherin-like beta sandwich domain-containing protein [Bacillota bacterium]
MKLTAKLLSCFIAAIMIITIIGPINAFAQGGEGDRNIDNGKGLGLKQPTEEEKSRFEKYALTAEEVLPNETALERINDERKEKGLEPLSESILAPEGTEIITKEHGNRTKLSSEELQALSDELLGSLPLEVDNSSLNSFPAVGDQGYIGSCAAFATTYYAATAETARMRGLDVKNGGSVYQLSPKFVYNLENNGWDYGSSIVGCINTLYYHGAPSWQDYPYDDNYLEYPATAEIWRSALGNRLTDYGIVYLFESEGTRSDEDLQNVKQMLGNGKLLVFATYITSWEYTTVSDNLDTAEDDPYIGQLSVKDMYGYDGGHAMTIVGYNDNIWVDVDGNSIMEPAEKGAFKVANSWATSYGNTGFVWMPYTAAIGFSSNPAAVYNGELYWVETGSTAYTPLMTADVTMQTARRDQLTLFMGANWNEASSPCPDHSFQPYYDTYYENHYINDYDIWEYGGPYSFAGTDSPSTATIVLDLTDYLKYYGFDAAGGSLAFCVGVWDSDLDDNVQTIQAITFKNCSTETEFTQTQTLPEIVDGGIEWYCGRNVLNPSIDPPLDDPGVQALPVITPGTPLWLNSEGDWDIKEYKFTPDTTGIYAFAATSPSVNMEIQNSARNRLYYYEGEVENSIIGVYEILFAGKTYVLRMWNGGYFYAAIQMISEDANSKANLSDIQLSYGILSPGFNAGVFDYRVSLPELVESTIITPIKVDPNATMTINEVNASSVTASVGNGSSSIYNIRVTAQDGVTSKTYSVTVNRAVSRDPYLSNINCTPGTLNRAFSKTRYSYTLTLDEYTASTIITPTKDNAGATMYINRVIQPSTTVTLDNGRSQTVKVKVVAQRGSPSKVYTIRVKRNKSTNNYLASLSASIGTLTPAFDPATRTYNLSLDEFTPGVTISAAKQETHATLKIDGRRVTSKTYTLNPGRSKTVRVTVRSQAGVTKRYTVVISRAPSTNADLSLIRTNSVLYPIAPAFDKDTLAYTVSLPAAKSSIKIYAKKIDRYAKIRINGRVTSSKTITLPAGGSTDVIIVVTSQSGTVVKTYTVTVTRAAI